MTHDEVVSLLQAATSYDNRRVDRVMIAAWLEASKRAGWTAADALEAVHNHYAHNVAWLMPGHVTEAIRSRRRYEPPIAELRAIDPPPPASPEKRAAVMRLVRELADRKAV